MLQNSLIITKTNRKSKYLNEDVIDLAVQNFVIPITFYYKIIEVTEDQIARPDLISMDLYDTDVFGDIICKLNGISNPFELNVGDRLVVPAPESLDDFMCNDTILEEEDMENTESKPTPKKKKEKRKANESIVGDSRFKIDQSNRIIIY